MEKKRFFEIMKEAGEYTEEEIERIWAGAPEDIDEEELKKKAKEYSRMKLHEVRVREELGRQLGKIQQGYIEKRLGKK